MLLMALPGNHDGQHNRCDLISVLAIASLAALSIIAWSSLLLAAHTECPTLTGRA
jgi:hypothetical protein